MDEIPDLFFEGPDPLAARKGSDEHATGPRRCDGQKSLRGTARAADLSARADPLGAGDPWASTRDGRSPGAASMTAWSS